MADNTVVAVRSIEIVTAEIHTIRDNVAKVFMDGVVQIGRRLEEAKQLVPQGEWLAYLDKELGYKPSTAQNYMRIAREFGDGQIGLSGKTPGDFFGNLGYSQLLPLLGLPEEEREQLAEEHDLAGMSSREIQALVRERDEAKASADKLKSSLEKKTQEAGTLKAKLRDETTRAEAAEQVSKANAQTAADLQRQLNELAEKADQPRDKVNCAGGAREGGLGQLTEEERAALREEIAAEQAEAVQAAEARASEALAKLEKVKNPAAHKVNFLFGELSEDWNRLRAALRELEQTDAEAAGKMRAAITGTVAGWTL